MASRVRYPTSASLGSGPTCTHQHQIHVYSSRWEFLENWARSSHCFRTDASRCLIRMHGAVGMNGDPSFGLRLDHLHRLQEKKLCHTRYVCEKVLVKSVSITLSGVKTGQCHLFGCPSSQSTVPILSRCSKELHDWKTTMPPEFAADIT